MKKTLLLLCGLSFGIVFLTQPVAVHELVETDYDPSTRTWTLSNGLIEVEYRLNEQDRFELLTLRRPNGKQWVSGAVPVSSPVYLNVDGRVLDQDTPWQLVETRESPAAREGKRRVITLRNEDAQAEVTLRLEIHPGQPVLRSFYSYRNLDQLPHFVEEARFFNLRLDTQANPMRAFYAFQVRQGTPLMFQTFEVDLARQPRRQVRLSAGAYADHCTWLALRDGADNGLVLGWEFNGRSDLRAQLNSFGRRVDISGSPLDLHVPVNPGAELTVPAGFVGLYEGDWDEAGYRTHRYVESVLASPLPDENFPYLMYNTWGYEENIDETTLRRAAQIAAQIGVEAFVVDLGWARQIGEWQEDSVKFPGGLRSFADYVRGLGMKFGMHFVPVEAAADSPALLENPDWTASVNNFYFGAESICLSNSATQQWLRSSALRLVRRYRVDWFTQDGENLVKECDKPTHTHDPLNSNWANSVEGIDAFVRYMRVLAPRTYWENNADGSTMSTFEAVKRYATFSSCDACEHEDRRRAVYGMSYVFPPRFIGRYMAEPPLKFTTRSSMFGGPWILMQRLTELTPAQIELLRQEAAIYKSLRPLIRDGKVYHLAERPTGYSIEAIESFHAESDRGVIFVYRPDSPTSSPTIFPRGLGSSNTYRVSFQESHDTYFQTGAALMAKGIKVSLPSKLSTEIVYLNRS